jgi:hypothetical protein
MAVGALAGHGGSGSRFRIGGGGVKSFKQRLAVVAARPVPVEGAPLAELLQESVKRVKSGKPVKNTIAILGGHECEKCGYQDSNITCEITPEGEFVLPTDEGLCVDLLYRARNRRLAIQREAERIEKLESDLREHFIETLSANSTGLAGREALVKVEPKSVPQIGDFMKLWRYAVKHNAPELFQRRLNETSVNERLDDPKQAKKFLAESGVTIFHAKKISVTKL